jgi:cbb3-type cytochrome c oxidase subunit I
MSWNPKPYASVKAWFLGSALWFVLGTLLGLIDATHMSSPELLGNIGWLVFGRVRPMHTNAVIYGFVGPALIGAAHYVLPSLVRTPLYSERLGVAGAWLWNITVALGTITLSMGFSQSREYAEWIWPVDIGVLAGLALVFYNLLRTVMNRRENVLYVSNWYFLAGIVYIFFIYFFGNAVWNPRTGSITGLADAQLAWFYGHGIVGLFLTPLAVAVAYYTVPIVTRSPLYSHALSLVGFWTILFIYAHIGTHHLLQLPMPTWLKVLAITGSIGMFVPVFTVLINLYLTMRGRLGFIHADMGGKFVMAGLIWYLIVCIQGPLQSLPIHQRVTHLNNWVIAHAHIAVLGFSGFIALGGMYLIIPRITGRPIHSRRLADIQYWLVLIGLTGFFLILSIAGLIQGNGWMNGELEYRLLPEIHLYFLLRSYLGVFVVAGAILGLYNMVKSFYGKSPAEDTP